jgi:hypothetical protein
VSRLSRQCGIINISRPVMGIALLYFRPVLCSAIFGTDDRPDYSSSTSKSRYVLCCCRTPEQCPSVVSLLAESYNPHVRYGAAMALGIACAGTGLKVSNGLTALRSLTSVLTRIQCSNHSQGHFFWLVNVCPSAFTIDL